MFSGIRRLLMAEPAAELVRLLEQGPPPVPGQVVPVRPEHLAALLMAGPAPVVQQAKARSFRRQRARLQAQRRRATFHGSRRSTASLLRTAR